VVVELRQNPHANAPNATHPHPTTTVPHPLHLRLMALVRWGAGGAGWSVQVGRLGTKHHFVDRVDLRAEALVIGVGGREGGLVGGVGV